MILFLEQNATMLAIEQLKTRLEFMGFSAIIENRSEQPLIAITHGMDNSIDMAQFASLPLVESVQPFKDQFKLVGKGLKTTPSVIEIKDYKIGDGSFSVMAGPCSIESREQIHSIARYVKASGASVLRGGAFKPRTLPYDFQGLGEAGLQYMREAADKYGLLCISELMAAEDLALVDHYVDIIQLGARNMQNFNLLKSLGKTQTPVLLKRGLSATYKEFLGAAEYIMSAGNPKVILCERGIRTFETYSRNTLDISAVPILKEMTHLPIVVDPSHAVGIRKFVPPLAKAALAVEADGIIIETHTDPDKSVSDANQAISPESYATMMQELKTMAAALNIPFQEYTHAES